MLEEDLPRFTYKKAPEEEIKFLMKAFGTDSTGINSGNTKEEIVAFYQQEKQYDKAYLFEKRMGKIHPFGFKEYVNLTKLSYRCGDSLMSYKYLDTAIVKSGGLETIDSYFKIASCYALMKNIKMAIKYLDKAFEKNITVESFSDQISPKEFAVLDNSKEFKALIDKYANDTSKLMGNVYYSWGDYPKAIRSYKSNIMNSDPDVPYSLAGCYSLEKDKENAITYFEMALNKGYNNYEWIQREKDLDYIRPTPEFKALMKKYFPNQYKR